MPRRTKCSGRFSDANKDVTPRRRTLPQRSGVGTEDDRDEPAARRVEVTLCFCNCDGALHDVVQRRPRENPRATDSRLNSCCFRRMLARKTTGISLIRASTPDGPSSRQPSDRSAAYFAAFATICGTFNSRLLWSEVACPVVLKQSMSLCFLSPKVLLSCAYIVKSREPWRTLLWLGTGFKGRKMAV